MLYMNNQASLYMFNNLGYLLTKVPDNLLKILQDEVEKIKKDFTKAPTYNKYLAGNIQYEFLIDNIPEFERYILNVAEAYESKFKYIHTINILTEDLLLCADHPWVNFMRKHEFNPPHLHHGIYSYVIWLEVPYDIEDEKQTASSIDSNANSPGHFGFITNNVLGEINVEYLPVDKSWNGVLCLFPSKMFHFVNPFSTSDEYRITIAGNILINTKDVKKKEEND